MKLLPEDEFRFVTSTENDLGAGKLIATSDECARVQYFSHPGADPHVEKEVGLNSLKSRELYKQTRVYHLEHATGAWRAGRIDDEDPAHNAYWVWFSGEEEGKLVRVPVSELEIRWQKPIHDPTDYLASEVTENPFYHDRRCCFISALVEQRACSGGLPSLLSSSIWIEEHQVEVARRVLQDPVQRYLLADEVGLGKTIEAGVIIRQYLLDHPNPNDLPVVVVVPAHLESQWRSELTGKFHLSEKLEKSIYLRTVKDLWKLKLEKGIRKGVGLLVMDEAHHLAKLQTSEKAQGQATYTHIAQLSHEAERLLLLSATPVLHHEREYLGMLHLIDPDQYGLDEKSQEAFLHRVEHRQTVADNYYSLQPDAADYFIKDALEELAEHFAGDARLKELSLKIRELIEQGRPEDEEVRAAAIRTIRAHLSDTYRLDRRVLRNRRAHKNIEVLVPGRRGLDLRCYEDPTRAQIENWLEGWRREASLAITHGDGTGTRARYTRTLLVLVECALGTPAAFLEAIETRMGTGGKSQFLDAGQRDALQQAPEFEWEREQLSDIRDWVRSELGEDSRLNHLVDCLAKLDEAGHKILVFATSSAVCDQIAQHLRDQMECPVARHSNDDASWTSFREDDKCHILVCDRGAEEGLNLQVQMPAVVHFDLPWLPLRVEQRLGRVDRFGTGGQIKSFAFVPEDSIFADKWVTYLDDGLRVFSQSIASLQHELADSVKRIENSLLDEGLDCLEAEISALSGENGIIATSLREIQAQDDFDALEWEEDEEPLADRILEVDVRSRDIEKAFDDWAVKTLKFRPIDNNSTKKSHRYQATRRTRMPVDDLIQRFLGAVDKTSPGFDYKQPRTPHLTYWRKKATGHGIRIARLGNPFIDGLAEYARWDDIGTCFALWRTWPGIKLEEDPYIGFRFDFLIEADVESAAEVLKRNSVGSSISSHALRRLGDRLFPPIYRSILTTEYGDPVPEDLVTCLESPYNKTGVYKGVDQGYKDTGIYTGMWELVEPFIQRETWPELCKSVRKSAEGLLRQEIRFDEEVQARAESARAYHGVCQAQLASRLEVLDSRYRGRESERAKSEDKVMTALVEGVQHPKLALDAVGVVFLSPSGMTRE